MIEKTTGYRIGDKLFTTLDEAKSAGLIELCKASNGFANESACSDVADFILAHQGAILDILTTGPKSKPKARAINGSTRKPRKPKTTLSDVVAKHQPEIFQKA